MAAGRKDEHREMDASLLEGGAYIRKKQELKFSADSGLIILIHPVEGKFKFSLFLPLFT